MKLDIGAGDNPTGDVNIDLRKLDSIDVRATATRLPFRAQIFDHVYASHVIEHLERAAVSVAIREWARVLRPNGRLEIRCPNLLAISVMIAIKRGAVRAGYLPNIDSLLELVFGGQANRYEYHRSGFTPPVLLSVLRENGFDNVEFKSPHCRARGLHSLTSFIARLFPLLLVTEIWVEARKLSLARG